MSDESIDISGMEDHFIIVDHTDNSGLSVIKPTEKDIRLFRIYGTMECGNTTHVIAYRNYRQLEQENAKLKERLKEAEKVAEDFILEKDHLKQCGIGMLNGDCCSCMDRGYYNLESCSERAREYFKKWGSDE